MSRAGIRITLSFCVCVACRADDRRRTSQQPTLSPIHCRIPTFVMTSRGFTEREGEVNIRQDITASAAAGGCCHWYSSICIRLQKVFPSQPIREIKSNADCCSTVVVLYGAGFYRRGRLGWDPLFFLIQQLEPKTHTLLSPVLFFGSLY